MAEGRHNQRSRNSIQPRAKIGLGAGQNLNVLLEGRVCVAGEEMCMCMKPLECETATS